MNIFDKIRRNDKTLCWEWTGALNRNGYGTFVLCMGGIRRRFMSHRVVYEAAVGPIAKGLVLDHLCRNRRCCNPRHLEPVTVKENTHRGEAILYVRQSTQP